MRLLLLLLLSVLAVNAGYIFFKMPQLLNPIDRWHIKGGQPPTAIKRFAGELVFGAEEWPPRYK